MLENNSDLSLNQIPGINPIKVIACCALLLIGLSIPTPAQQKKKPQPCGKAQSQGEMNICWGNEYKKADMVLNQVYRKLAAMLDEEPKAQLKEAQLAWISYRDKNCAFVADVYKGGSLRPTVFAICLFDVTNNRTAELRNQFNEKNF